MKRILSYLALLLLPLAGFAQSDTLRVKTVNPVPFDTWLQLQPLSHITGQRILDTILTGKFNYANGGSGGGTGGGGGDTTTTPPPPAGQFVFDMSQGYNINSYGTNLLAGGPLGQLVDRDTTTNVQQGYGMLLSTNNFWIPLTNTTSGLTITNIKLYSYQGSGSSPWLMYAVASNGSETLLASFSGGQYRAWINYNISNVLAQKIHIVTTSNTLWPTEMKVNGSWTSKAITYSPSPTIALSDELGVNTFLWSFLNPTAPSTFLPNALKTFNGMSAVRLYTSWKYVEPTTQGLNTFSPSHSGSWSIDTTLYTLKKAGILVLFDLKEQAPWMQSTWPGGGDGENIPVMYSNFANIGLPSAYREQARTGYQIALRYGSTRISTSNATIDRTTQWTGDPANVARTGLNTLTYIECDNERDKWWKGLNAWQSGAQYAANLSAFYDGNLNTMGAGIGVKNADPNMQVVYAGTADVTSNGFLGAIQWCNDHRGGQLDWDVFNIHAYALTVMPESGLFPVIAPLVKIARQYNKPIWLTESGYDQQSGSPNAAPSIGSKSVPLVQADWILRTVLGCARNGISRSFIYQDYDNLPGNATQYETAGIFSNTTTTFHKPAGDYLTQVGLLMKGFNFFSTSTPNGIIVDVYKNPSTGKVCNVYWSPTMTGVSRSYTVPAGVIYTPTAGAINMAHVATTGAATVSETPIFDMVN